MYNIFSVYGSVAAVTSGTALANLVASTSVRPYVQEFDIGCAATPNDIATRFQWQRSTAAGTAGSSFTPVPRDSNDRAAVTTVGLGTFSVQPTLTSNAIVWSQSLNQRCSYHWVASPRCEIIAPATNSNGLCLNEPFSGGTANQDFSIIFGE